MGIPRGQSRGKRGNRKHGRDKEKCARFRVKHQREKNRIRRLSKLIRKAERLGWGNVAQIKSARDRAKARLY